MTIDLAAIGANYRALAQRAARAETAAAVKGDGYGLGLEPVVGALAEAGCRTFFVAHLSEAERLRAALPDRGVTTYVLNGLLVGTAMEYVRLGARPVLGSLEEIDEWRDFAAGCDDAPAVALNIDTGFNRLGLAGDDVATLRSGPERLNGISVALMMSHLACADDRLHPMNEEQRRLFESVRGALPVVPASLANSGGIFLGDAFHLDLVRPGIALYGGRSIGGDDNTMLPVVGLEVPVVQVRDVAQGAVIGYGATYRFTSQARVAVVSIGYADGFLRFLGGSDERSGGRLYVAGHPAPLVGRVSMDLVAIDVSDIPERHVFRGAAVEVIGKHQSIDDLADQAGTISYEVLTRLGLRHTRVYSSA